MRAKTVKRVKSTKVKLDTTATANNNAMNLDILMPCGTKILNVNDMLEETDQNTYKELDEPTKIEVK